MKNPLCEIYSSLNPLLLCRRHELRHLKWSQVRLDDGYIEVPPISTRKTKYYIPLSNQAKTLFLELQTYAGDNQLVFPSRHNPLQPISATDLTLYMRGTGTKMVELRKHAAKVLVKRMKFSMECVETQLDHNAPEDPMAYWEERQRMMERWAQYVSGAHLRGLAK